MAHNIDRIRKKARYQELLDREQKFLEHQQEGELDQKRRQAVMGFLRVRALMLQGALQLALASDNGESLSTTEKETRQPTDRSVSFDHSDSSALKAAPTLDDVASRLSELLENKESFRFETPLVSAPCR